MSIWRKDPAEQQRLNRSSRKCQEGKLCSELAVGKPPGKTRGYTGLGSEDFCVVPILKRAAKF